MSINPALSNLVKSALSSFVNPAVFVFVLGFFKSVKQDLIGLVIVNDSCATNFFVGNIQIPSIDNWFLGIKILDISEKVLVPFLSVLQSHQSPSAIWYV